MTEDDIRQVLARMAAGGMVADVAPRVVSRDQALAALALVKTFRSRVATIGLLRDDEQDDLFRALADVGEWNCGHSTDRLG